MKAKIYGKQMPKGEARPLGTKAKKINRADAARQKIADRRTKAATDDLIFGKSSAEEKISAETQKVVDTAAEVEVRLQQTTEPQAVPPAGGQTDQIQEQNVMTLSLKGLSRNGKRAIYAGAAQSINFSLGLFPGKVAPPYIEVADGTFAEPKVKVARVKLTKEERAALPKPTLAEKIAKREAQLAKDKAKLAAGNDL